MFYLIGVNHNVQRHPAGAALDADQTELQRRIETAIKDYRPSLIAIEESDETLFNRKTGGADESIPRKVAQTHGIRSLFCEMTNDEKRLAGYECKSQILLELSMGDLPNDVPPPLMEVAAHAVEMVVMFPIREEHWITKLKDYLHSEVVLVLGEDHIESFGSRLRKQGIESRVIRSGIGVLSEHRTAFEAAKKFQIDYPKQFAEMIQQAERRRLDQRQAP